MSVQTDFCMPLLVRQCLRERITGTLTVCRTLRTAERMLFVENGAVVFATSRNGNDLFGERLVEWGRISRSQLDEGLKRRQETGEKLGRALVALSFLTPSDVRANIQRLITERVAEVFDWTSGEVLYDTNLPGKGEPSIATTPQMLLLRGVQCVSDIDRVQRWLGDIDQLFVPIPEPFQFFDMLSLRPEEAFIISRLDQPVTPRDLLSLGSFDEQLVLRVVCALRFAGVLEPAPSQSKKVFWLGDGVTFDQLVVRTTSVPAAPANGTTKPLGSAGPAIDAGEAARICFLVEEKLHAIADGADYYALLELERRVPTDRIKSAYRELAKTFHPDRHAQLAGIDGDIKDRLSHAFDAITRAYTTLSNPNDRAMYDAELQKRDQRSAVRTPAPSPPPPPVVRTPPPVRPKPPSGPVMPPVKPLPRQNVAPMAPRPGPPPSASPSPKPSTSAPSGQSDRAASRPASPPQRPPSPPPPPPTAPPARDAAQFDLSPSFAPVPTVAELIARGAEFVEAGDHNQAVRAFRKAIELAPDDGETHAALGRSLARLKGYSREAEKSLKHAIELEPENERHLVALAQLYKAFGRKRDARDLVLQALVLNPDSVEAQDLAGALPDLDAGQRVESRVDDPSLLRRIFKRETK